MSTPSPQGGGHRREPVQNLRETTQDELHEARRERRGWRRRKVGMLLMVLPVAAIAAAGFALAAPDHHGALPAGCGGTTAAAAGTSAAAVASGGGGGTTASAASGSTSSAPAQTTSAVTTGGNGGGASSAASSSAGTGTGAGTGASASAGTTSAAASTAPTNAAPTNAAPTNAAPTNAAPTNAAPTNTAPTNTAPTNVAATTTAPCASASAGAAATPNPNCSITVPANPLTAQGLATPYTLTATDAAMGPCNEANANQSAFVQATIYDPATGALTVYNPLVIDQGTQPAVAPVVPTLPAGAVVGIWFGFDATNLTLADSNGSLNAGKCVNGLNGSVFTQYAYCNAPAFFTAVNAGIKAGMVTVPNPGTATDGQACMTTRNFALIDQDQSDNVTSQYLATANGQIAQNNAANLASMPNAAVLSNPSDNGLLDNFIDPALGCKPWTMPNLGDNGAPGTSLALDEIQANAFPTNPSALVPLNDPMTLDGNGNFSTQKTNLYRQGVDQPNLPTGESPQQYCSDMDRIQGTRLQQDVNLLIGGPSPDPGAASNLFNFVAMRLQQSFGNLNCQNFHLTNPVSTLGTDANGVVDAVVFAQTVKPTTPGAGNPAQKCVSQRSAAAQMSCALNAVGATPPPASTPTPPEASPTGSATKTPQPKHHRGSHHWW